MPYNWGSGLKKRNFLTVHPLPPQNQESKLAYLAKNGAKWGRVERNWGKPDKNPGKMGQKWGKVTRPYS